MSQSPSDKKYEELVKRLRIEHTAYGRVGQLRAFHNEAADAIEALVALSHELAPPPELLSGRPEFYSSPVAASSTRRTGTEGERETVDEVLSIVESYGPWGTDINESLRFQIVLADEVKRLRIARDAFSRDASDLQHDLDVMRAAASAIAPLEKHQLAWLDGAITSYELQFAKTGGVSTVGESAAWLLGTLKDYRKLVSPTDGTAKP